MTYECDCCEESVDEGTHIWVNYPHAPFITKFICVGCNRIYGATARKLWKKQYEVIE